MIRGAVVRLSAWTLLVLFVFGLGSSASGDPVCLRQTLQGHYVIDHILYNHDHRRFTAALRGPHGQLILGTYEDGISFRNGSALDPIGPNNPHIGAVVGLHITPNGSLLIGAYNGLFLRSRGVVTQILDKKSVASGAYWAFLDTSGGTLIGNPGGLFRFKNGSAQPLEHASQVSGGVEVLFQATDGTVLVGGNKGLFLFQAGDLAPLANGETTGEIDALYEVGAHEFLIGAGRGLFRLHQNELIEMMSNNRTGRIWTFHKDRDDSILMGASYVFKIHPNYTVSDVDSGPVAQAFFDFYDAGGETFAASWAGLFRLDGDQTAPVSSDENTGAIHGFNYEQDGPLIIAENGLFRLTQAPWSQAHVTSPTYTDISAGVGTTFKWTIDHPCAFALNNYDVRVIPKAGSKIADVHDSRSAIGRRPTSFDVSATVTLTKLADESYKVQLWASDDTSSVGLGGPVSVRVGWDFDDYAKYYGKIVAWALAILQAIVFVFLIVGARWSRLCWSLVTDPIWNKAGLWFYFALRHVPFLQRWIMSRWFDAIRQETRMQPYLPMTLTDERGAIGARTTDLLNLPRPWQRLWLQGNAGMGKTSLVLFLKAAFFADANLDSLGKAFTRFRCIPIIIPLREFRHTAFDPARPEEWVPNAARLAVSSFGLRFDDQNLFRSIIGTGNYLLVLDGANEVEWNDEIELFARSASNIPLLVTSQFTGSDFFMNWKLPREIADDVKPLLCLLLEQVVGETVYGRIKNTPLLKALRSGYDVRLLADLVEDGGPSVVLPTDRLGLYRLILDSIRLPDDAPYPEEQLCQAAWHMWVAGERTLEAGKQIAEELVRPLLSERQKVLRIIDGQRFEFRHDQMRAYLAGRWAAEHEVRPISLFESETAIWRLSRKEQDEVWSFFAEMLVAKNSHNAADVWKWATKDPDTVILQHALQQALEESGNAAEMSLG